jgi:hypothetical protein
MFFTNRDVETDDEGEILVENGDFKLANTERTAIQLVNFVVLTDWGDYTPSPRTGANLAEYIGQHNINRTHLLMMENLRHAFNRQRALETYALEVQVHEIGDDEAGVMIQIKAVFDDLDEDERSYGSPILGYKFPFYSAQIERIDLP